MTNEVTTDVSNVEHILERSYEFDSGLLTKVFELAMSEGIVVGNSSHEHFKAHCEILQQSELFQAVFFS